MKRIIGYILALVTAITMIPISSATAANNHKTTHCGVRAHWDGSTKDTDKETTITAWWRVSNVAANKVQACVRAEDRRHTKKAINLDVYIIDQVSREIHVRGGNVAETLFVMDWETNAFIASAYLTKSNRESWIVWNR